jgi:nucleoid-associated protein YgaU
MISLPNGYQQAFLEVEGDPPRIWCWFNPKEYSISKSNSWETKPVVGAALPSAQFTGGEPRTLGLDLIFDDSDDEDGDVRAVTDRLFKMMEIDRRFGSGNENSGRPPTVTFNWGDTVSFKAVCKQLRVQFTLFRANGVPIRCAANLQLTQTEKAADKSSGAGREKRPNPTTMGLAGVSSHVIREGDSLPSIAYAAYGDATQWRVIAQANGIDDPLRLPRGVALSIPRSSA